MTSKSMSGEMGVGKMREIILSRWQNGGGIRKRSRERRAKKKNTQKHPGTPLHFVVIFGKENPVHVHFSEVQSEQDGERNGGQRSENARKAVR